MQKSYYAIIPADVRYSDLTPNAKLLYGEITALCNEKGYCWASNDYFSDLYGTSKETISRWISQLRKYSFIDVTMTYRKDSKEIDKRIITLLTKSSIPSPQNRQYPLDEIVKDNTTVNTKDIYIGEIEFLELWSRARTYYDKKVTNISKLSVNERGNFNDLLKDYCKKDFEQAIAGLFFQDTLPGVRVRPTHLLDRQYFETYLDCWRNKTKIYTKYKKKNDNTGMI